MRNIRIPQVFTLIRSADQFLLKLHNEGKSVKYIANKMGRSQTSIVMRLNKLNQ